MALETYRQKRRFGVTPEPRGTRAKRSGDRFVIQKHAARRLHYDLRLELDGVMKSWAVTRGPSLVPGDKRLAVEVEDHPIEYNTFEGTIPEGEYGGGTVLIWDRGHWHPEGDPHAGLRKGSLDFTLAGEKLEGRFHLVRMRGRPNEKRTNWLLIKGNDEFATRPGRARRPRTDARFGRDRTLDFRDRGGQRRQARLALEPRRRRNQESDHDAKQGEGRSPQTGELSQGHGRTHRSPAAATHGSQEDESKEEEVRRRRLAVTGLRAPLSRHPGGTSAGRSRMDP